MAKKMETEMLVAIPAGTIGTIVSRYTSKEGVTVNVAEFDDNMWAWVGESACTFVDRSGMNQ